MRLPRRRITSRTTGTGSTPQGPPHIAADGGGRVPTFLTVARGGLAPRCALSQAHDFHGTFPAGCPRMPPSASIALLLRSAHAVFPAVLAMLLTGAAWVGESSTDAPPNTPRDSAYFEQR